MNRTIGAATRVYALLGDPVSHSRSPDMVNAAFAEQGIDAVYVALRCTEADVPTLVRTIAHTGGGGNITVPHKARARTAIDRPSEAVVRTGACNTFWARDGLVYGDNTDVEGVHVATSALIGSAAGIRVLLLGAGGAARAAAWALIEAGAARVDVLNRTPHRAAQLVHGLGTARLRVAHQIGSADLLVNATTLGLRPHDRLPMRENMLPHFGAVLDLVYQPDETPLVRAARQAGVPAMDGTVMLLAQGAAAYRCWTGRDAPLEVMRAALDAGGADPVGRAAAGADYD
ncbi:MAG TPA: shikimate dehydrogenase [Longimicrobiales bacterium]|nr:shikimate dehydrogenase [Longimicrobiales bacterium]